MFHRLRQQLRLAAWFWTALEAFSLCRRLNCRACRRTRRWGTGGFDRQILAELPRPSAQAAGGLLDYRRWRFDARGLRAPFDVPVQDLMA